MNDRILQIRFAAMFILLAAATATMLALPSDPSVPSTPIPSGDPSETTPPPPPTEEAGDLETRQASTADQACSGPGGQWACWNRPRPNAPRAAGSPVNPGSWKVASWFVDGLNTTGCASDGNSCTTATCGPAGSGLGPCATISVIQQARWGGAPILPQATTITGLSAYQTADCWATNPITAGDAGSFALAGSYLPTFCALSPNGFAVGVVGDAGLSGNATSFQSVPISATTLGASQVYVGNPNGTVFVLRQLTLDDILPGFSISCFSVSGGTVEVGANITNPTVSSSYSATPASAHVANTDSIDSPLTLTSPFTTGTIVGTFTHAAAATVTFTLTAVSTGSVTKTATASETWEFRTCAGPATAGATSATASGTSAVLNGGAGTLPSVGLFSSIVGLTISVTLAGNNAYVMTPHTPSPHTWLAGGFTFPMNAPITFSFTNANGVASSYDLYQSTNVLTGTVAIECAS